MTSNIDDRTAPYGALLLRLSLGAVFLAHGLLKFIVFGLPGTAAYFASVGFPGWSAYVVAPLEVVGGALLITGHYERSRAPRTSDGVITLRHKILP